MKKIFFILAVAAIALSCKKENISGYQDQLSGSWEYIQFTGFGVFPPPLPAGNGKILYFGKDGTFERRQHDTVLYRGTYKLLKIKACYSGGDDDYIINTSDDSYNNNSVVNFQNDTLYLGTPGCVADGGAASYKKL